MNKIFKHTTLLFMATLFCMVATRTPAQNGIYLTLQSGWANQPTLAKPAMVGALRKEAPDFPAAYRGAIGYNHDFWHWLGFGFEVGYGCYGGTVFVFPTGTVKVTAYTAEFLTKTLWHISKHWDAMLTLGGVRHTTDITGLITATGGMRIQPEAGLGTIYIINRHLGVVIAYNHTFGKQLTRLNGTEFKRSSLNEFLAGLRITFG